MNRDAIHNTKGLKTLLIEEVGERVFDFISKEIDISDHHVSVHNTTNPFNIIALDDDYFQAIVNIHRINDIKKINKFFEAVNSKLKPGGKFVCCVETSYLRKLRILRRYPGVINGIYYFFDFLVKRVFPKLKITKRLYFILTGGKNRVIARAEAIGRIYSCGFKILEERNFDYNLYFLAEKVEEPAFDSEPSYGPLFAMRRVGKGGKIIKVYKLRTMSPFAEYAQLYVYEKNQLAEGGKIKDDFRVTTAGRFFRKFWLDELPMIINLLKGDLKIVGVRPLSKHYLSLYTPELIEKRLKVKPGLIPPFYADMPKTLDEIMASELKYLNAYEKSPFTTDVKYFIKIFYNIIFKKARSK